MAAAYLKEHGVGEVVTAITKKIVEERPHDPLLAFQLLLQEHNAPKKYSFLAGAKQSVGLPPIDGVKGKDVATIAGEFSAYTDAVEEQHKAMMRNKVKKCPGCGKPNGFTLAACNSCGTSLVEVAISFTPNVFMGFILGVERGGFPYTISIRHEQEDILCFDDLLALSPLHFNAIPTKEWIPDWRFLLRNPKRGLAVVQQLHAKCIDVAKTKYLANPDFSNTMFKAGTTFVAEEILAGFNYPPSQYQLHVQFMCPVLMPHQRYLFEKGVHYTKGRFFPLSYVVTCLTLAEASPLPADLLLDTTDIDAITKHFAAKHGHDYDAEHASFYAQADALYTKYANWQPRDFTHEVVHIEGAEMALRAVGSTDAPTVDVAMAKQLIEADKLVLQNYGRPYTTGGKPGGSYYSFPKKVEEVTAW